MSNNSTQNDVTKANVKSVVIPYAHKIANNMKHVAVRYKVPVAFSAPKKLSSLCCKTDPTKHKKADCRKKHRNPFVKCVVSVVYQIPLTCGRLYIGQTGRCINDRLADRYRAVQNGTGTLIPHHCQEKSAGIKKRNYASQASRD